MFLLQYKYPCGTESWFITVGIDQSALLNVQNIVIAITFSNNSCLSVFNYNGSVIMFWIS